MANQMIYTRCYPCRDMRQDGQVIRSEGYGIFSFSRELLLDCTKEERDFLQNRMAVKNGADESSTGLLCSYEYDRVSEDTWLLSYEVARGLCSEPRANGIGHRLGNYIKQGIAGKLEGLPCRWFGADVWTAHQYSQNAYYLDEGENAEPDWLPQVPDTPGNSGITKAEVKAFVADGRSEALKAALWFLMGEYNKPQEKRKVLLIRDYPEMVEKWIAAIEYAFPEGMARQITFATNRANLNTKLNYALYYYTDPSGKVDQIQNAGSAQIRHPYCMVVGFHPKDESCDMVRQDSSPDYALIDGEAKRACFETDEKVRAAYYKDAVEYRPELGEFFGHFITRLPIHDVTGLLPDIYDAWWYLRNVEEKGVRPGYEDMLRALQTVVLFGIPESMELNSYLLRLALSAYADMLESDESGSYPMLKIMWQLAQVTGQKADIIQTIGDKILDQCANLTQNGTRLVHTWKQLCNADITDIVLPVLQLIFADRNPDHMVSQFALVDREVVYTVMDMFFFFREREPAGMNGVGREESIYTFIMQGLMSLIPDNDKIQKVFLRLGSNPALIDSVIVSVGNALEQNGTDERSILSWWDSVFLYYKHDAAKICSRFFGMQDFTIDIADRIIGKIPLAELGTAIEAIRNCRMQRDIELAVYNRIDRTLPFDGQGINTKVYAQMDRWGEKLGTCCQSHAFYEFAKQFSRTRNVEDALRLAEDMVKCHLTLRQDMCESDYFRKLAVTAGLYNSPQLHLYMLFLAETENAKLEERYMDIYVSKVLSSAGRQIVQRMLVLCSAAVYECSVPGWTDEMVIRKRGLLEQMLQLKIAAAYKPKMMNQLAKISYEKEVKNMVQQIFDKTNERYNQKNSGKLLGIFRRK